MGFGGHFGPSVNNMLLAEIRLLLTEPFVSYLTRSCTSLCTMTPPCFSLALA